MIQKVTGSNCTICRQRPALFLFDVDDTLYDMAQPFRRAYAECFGTRFEVSLEGLHRASRIHSDEVYEASRTGRISMDEMYIYRMTRSFADFGIAITDEEALGFQSVYARCQGQIEMSPTMEAILDRCAATSRVGIVTNGPDEHQRRKARALGLERWVGPEAVFTSGGMGVAKPDPRIFLLACERLGTRLSRCVFVGDTFENDVVGAHAAGMPVVWFNRRGHARPTSPSPTWTVTSEQGLLDLLTRL